MTWNAKVIADSVAPNGRRAISLELCYPRFVHSEVLTHRDRARNSSSSRAIKWPAMCARIESDPVIPLEWVTEQRGMIGGKPLAGKKAEEATKIWLKLRDNALHGAQQLADLGIHKSLCNRVTEPWMWITTIMTATQWKHFLRLRVHPDAEQHFQYLGRLIIKAIKASVPKKLDLGQWHLPYVDNEDLAYGHNLDEKKLSPATQQLLLKHFGDNINHGGVEMYKMASVARCARVSIVSPGEVARSMQKDMETFDRLHCGSALVGDEEFASLPHISPYEHVLQALPTACRDTWSGCVRGFKQYRKELANEYIDTDYPTNWDWAGID